MSTSPQLPVLIAGAKAQLRGLAPKLVEQISHLLTDRAGRWRLAAAGVWGFVNLPAAVVMIRSAGDEPSQTLTSMGTVGLAFLFFGSGLTASGLWCSFEMPSANRREVYWRRTWQVFLSTFPLAILWDTSVPPHSPFAAAVVITCGLLAAAAAGIGPWWELLSLLPEIDVPETSLKKPALETRIGDFPAIPPASPSVSLLADDSEDISEDEEEAEPESEALSQWQKRTLIEGLDVIEGFALARFRTGEKQVQLHVAFCPPLEKSPRIEHFIPEGIPARSKVAACYSYGLRFELRRSSDITDELEFPVHYKAFVNREPADSMHSAESYAAASVQR